MKDVGDKVKISDVSLIISAVRRSQYPTDEKPEFLLVGRSNVGKSSFINSIINRKNYARTSSNPGKTQTINFYLVNENFYLVDAPGYGYANVNKQMKKKFGLMMEDYLVNRPTLKQVFMLIDFRHKPTSDDKMMYDFLRHYKIPVTIVATKSDKVGISGHQKQRSIILNELDLVLGDDFVVFSNITKVGRDEIYEKIERII
ncbi:MAG: ribosome biogenesis GTP-binding protein YihA/YsxC [Bacilli bacterium]|nr:ribosome biogenesis GTP-binding protein YihA/YsxC [Bacilli bacterium]